MEVFKTQLHCHLLQEASFQLASSPSHTFLSWDLPFSPLLILTALYSLSTRILACVCVTTVGLMWEAMRAGPSASRTAHRSSRITKCAYHNANSVCYKSNHLLNICPLAVFQKIIRTSWRKELGRY